MQEFVETLKKGAEKAIDSAEIVTKKAIKKTSESVNIVKLKIAAKDIEGNIENIYSELGKMLYNEYKEGAEFEGEYKEMCEKISAHLEEITILKTKIAEISNKQICPVCEKYTDEGARYCSACGHEFN